MRDLVLEKASPFAFVIVIAWYLDAPRNLLRSCLFELCWNACQFFGLMANFFR